MNKPLVSIVIPLYNGANYVEEALKSAIEQSYERIEIVVVNDGSTDNGAGKAICDRYADKIVYLEKENGGCASALNYGIRHAKGEFISWLSHDDIYDKTKVEKQLAFYDRYDLRKDNTIVSNVGSLVDSQGKRIPHPVRKDTGFLPSQQAFSYMLFKSCPNGCGLLIPKCIFERHGFFDESLRFVLDWNLWLKFALSGVDFYFDDESLVANRVHSMQVTVRQRELHAKEANETVDWLCATMKERGSEDVYWKLLYKFSYACSRGDSKAIKIELKKRNAKVPRIKLFLAKAQNKCKRLAKRIYHRFR